MPHTDTLWMDYGSGENLQVWAIETSGYHDTIVEKYKDDHQVSFPFFSTKTNEHIMDSFPISYTPWYYVICPDKSLRHVEYEDLRDYINACSLQEGIKENDKQKDYIYYANLEIVIYSFQKNKDWIFSIYNMSGQKVFVGSYRTNEFTNRIKLDLKEGLYIFDSRSKEGERVTKKIRI